MSQITRINRTALSGTEWATRLIASFARAAKQTTCPDLAGWYARECVRIARQFDIQK